MMTQCFHQLTINHSYTSYFQHTLQLPQRGHGHVIDRVGHIQYSDVIVIISMV